MSRRHIPILRLDIVLPNIVAIFLLPIVAGIPDLSAQLIKSNWVEFPIPETLKSKGIQPKFLAVNQFMDIYLLDDENYWLVTLPSDEGEPRVAGGWGDSGENFSFPTDLFSSPALDIYVCDQGTNRVLWYDRKLNFLGQLDFQEITPFSIEFPEKVVVNPLGELFVSNAKNWTVTFISTDRKLVNQIGHTFYGEDRFGNIFHMSLGKDNSIGIVDSRKRLFYWIDRSGTIIEKKMLPEKECFVQWWKNRWLLLGKSGNLYESDTSLDSFRIIPSGEKNLSHIIPTDFDIMGDTMFTIDEITRKIYTSTIKLLE